MNFYAGQKPGADLLYALSYADTYVPALTATTTDPNLGADGTATGWFHRNGLLITGGARFLFDGTGVSAGSGIFEISTPFDADLSIMESSTSGEDGSRVGYGRIRDNSAGANSAVVVLQLSAAGALRMYVSGTNSSVSDSSPVVWAAQDAISVQFSIIADPAGFSFGT